MNTEYKVLYTSVLSKIKDYDFFTLNENQLFEILHDYLRPAIVRFRSCKQDLSLRDDMTQTFLIKLSDDEVEIISDFMVVEYLDANYIRVPTAMKSILSNKDFNTFSPANMLNTVMSVRNKYLLEAEQLMYYYSYRWADVFQCKG